MTIVAGTIILQIPISEHPIETIYIHEEYNSRDSYANDIALIKVCNFIMINIYYDKFFLNFN